MVLISEQFRQNMLLGFRLDSCAAQIPAQLATLIPRGAPSRPGWASIPGPGLSAGALLGASC